MERPNKWGLPPIAPPELNSSRPASKRTRKAMYRYFHNARDRSVHRYNCDVRVEPNRGPRGGRSIGWYVSTTEDIARADNVLTGNRWRYNTSQIYSRSFEPKYSKDEAIEYFLQHVLHHGPHVREIDAAEYERLRQEYEAAALKNSAQPQSA